MMNKADDERFTAFLREKATEAKRDLGYDPKQFIGMLNADGGYATVSKLVGGKNPSDGFTKLWQKGRLDLSVEALVLETEWIQFFDEQLVKHAERKLKAVEYKYLRFELPIQNERLPAETLNKVTPEFIWNAVQKLKNGEVAHLFSPSTDYDLIADDGRRFPPKAVFGAALSMVLEGIAVEPKHFSAGDSSQCFRLLREAGYQIVPKASPATGRDEVGDLRQEWHEGDAKLVSHLRRERAPGLSRAKKAQYRRLHGRLTCENCKLDPVTVYGTEHAEACIEVHHSTIHISEMPDGHKTTLEDVQCLCANCHRLVHRMLREQQRQTKQFNE